MSGAKRKQRAKPCDTCRRRKVRCDGNADVGSTCSNCKSFHYECTYVGGRDTSRYVKTLELEIQRLKQALKQASDTNSPYNDGSGSDRLSGSNSPLDFSIDDDAGFTSEEDDGLVVGDWLSQNFKSMAFDEGVRHTYHGKSSSLNLIRDTLGLGKADTGNSFSLSDLFNQGPGNWDAHPWMDETLQRPAQLDFPEPKLMASLTQLYFAEYNDFQWPVLHRPTFMQLVQSGQHLRDEAFGVIVLLACALGSRFSDDRRVLLANSDSWHTAGWKWFRQVQQRRQLIVMSPPTVYDLQTDCLSAMYLNRCSRPYVSWTVTGDGLRRAVEMGAHRRAVYKTLPKHIGESMKRAFWALMDMDRALCAVFGRTPAMREEDYDVDLPLEVDDEYWTNPDSDLVFVQPAGKPSYVTFFNCILRLGRIHSLAIRSMVESGGSGKIPSELKHSKMFQHLGKELKDWLESVPDHLRWDPYNPDLTSMAQSAHLYTQYYQTQINLYRPFLSSANSPTPTTLNALAICTNAARACVRIVDTLFIRAGSAYYNHSQEGVILSAALFLLLSVQGAKQQGISVDTTNDLMDVHRCVRILQELSSVYYMSSQLWKTITFVADKAGLVLPPVRYQSPEPRGFSKRVARSNLSELSSDFGGPAYAYSQQHKEPMLPMSTEELSQLPVHAVFPSYASPGHSPPMSSTQGPTSRAAAAVAASHPPFTPSATVADNMSRAAEYASAYHHHQYLPAASTMEPQRPDRVGFGLVLTNGSHGYAACKGERIAMQEKECSMWATNNSSTFMWDGWDSYTASITDLHAGKAV